MNNWFGLVGQSSAGASGNSGRSAGDLGMRSLPLYGPVGRALKAVRSLGWAPLGGC